MEIKTGTIEPLIVEEENGPHHKPRLERGNGNGSNGGDRRKGGGGNDDDGGGDGGSGPEDPHKLEAEERNRAANDSITKYRISMWAIIVVALMTFLGLGATYMILAANDELEWRPFGLPFQLWLSTALILISSLTFEFGKNNLYSNNQKTARTWLMVTTALGAVFIASQLMAWLQLVAAGVYMTGNPYAGFFYILTVAHALHVVGGMGALGYVMLRTANPTKSKDELQRRIAATTISGWFWHFLSVLWIGLFLLLGFWK